MVISVHLFCLLIPISTKLGLTGHLKTHFPTMYRLFLLLKDHEEPPTDEEKAIAAGEKDLDPAKTTEYLAQLEKASTSIVYMFTQQHQHAVVSYIIDAVFECIN